MIYGEISPYSAATGGWVFVKAEGLLQHNEIQNGFLWEADLIKAQMARLLGMNVDDQGVIHIVEYGINIWEYLLENMKDGINWSDAFEAIAKIEDFLKFIRRVAPKITIKRK